MPYTLHVNDIVDYETRYFSTAMYADDLKAEFDALYAEAGTRRRMMSVSARTIASSVDRLVPECSNSSLCMLNPIRVSRLCVKMRLRALLWKAP